MKKNLIVKEITDKEYVIQDGANKLIYPRVTSVIRFILDRMKIARVEAMLKRNEFDISKISRMLQPDEIQTRAMAFGTAVHQMCEWYDNGTLKEATLDENLKPYLEGWKKYRKENPWSAKHLLSETHVMSKIFGYAGTPDRFYENKNLIDIKSGEELDLTGLQLAAYEQAVYETFGLRAKRRYAVYLTPGKYRLVPYTSLKDFRIFTSCLDIYRFAQECNF